MLKICLRPVFRFSKFKLDDYTYEDYATMCGLIRQKFQFHNDQVQTSGLVKLLDDSGRVIGMYTASEARRKASTLGLDMVLVNKSSSPIVCKVADFRDKVVSRFYEEVVLKVQSKEQIRAKSTKSIKVSSNLAKNDMIVKTKQIVQLVAKYAKVRVFMNVKQSQRDDSLSKLEGLKSFLMNKCYIEEEVSNRRFEDEEDEGKPESQVETFSFVIKAKEFDVVKRPQEDKKQEPNEAVRRFIAKYYTQTDGEMMDLRSAGNFEVETGVFEEKKTGDTQDIMEQRSEYEHYMEKEAEARVLNKRLKVLLAFTL